MSRAVVVTWLEFQKNQGNLEQMLIDKFDNQLAFATIPEAQARKESDVVKTTDKKNAE